MSDVFGGQESAAIEAAQGSEKPLTDQERALLQRLLSDPFSIPQQFKTWLVAYLEGSDMLLARSSVQGLSDLLGSGGGQGIMGLLPAGIIFPYGGTAEPVGAKLCNGQLLSRTGYKRLFDAIGTIYGVGDGSTTFAVPDLRRRVPYGAGVSAPQGDSDGKAEASRSIKHHHGFGQTSGGGGAHSHSVSGSTDSQGNHSHGPLSNQYAVTDGTTSTFAAGSGVFRVVNRHANTADAGSHSHNLSGGTDNPGNHTHFVSGDTTGGGEQDNPSYLTVGFIINY